MAALTLDFCPNFMYNMGVGISGCLKSGCLGIVTDFPYKVSRLVSAGGLLSVYLGLDV